MVYVGHDDCKLVAADAENVVADAEVFLDGFSHLFEHFVAHIVAHIVVETLEIVDIE